MLLTPLEIGNPMNPVELLKSCMAERRQTHILLTVMRLEDELNGLKAGQMSALYRRRKFSDFWNTPIGVGRSYSTISL